MSRKRNLLLAFVICAGLVSASAVKAEAPIYDGITLAQLQSALSAGFAVESDKTSDGNAFLWVRGRDDLIAAHLVHCGGKPRCEGVRYFSVTDATPSLSFVNQFNREYDYSKASLNSKGRAVLSLEIYSVGGVAGENLVHSAAMLMLRMDGFKAAMSGQVKSEGPLGGSSTLADAARAKRAFESQLPGKPSMSARPTDNGIMKAYLKELDSSN